MQENIPNQFRGGPSIRPSFKIARLKNAPIFGRGVKIARLSKMRGFDKCANKLAAGQNCAVASLATINRESSFRPYERLPTLKKYHYEYFKGVSRPKKVLVP